VNVCALINAVLELSRYLVLLSVVTYSLSLGKTPFSRGPSKFLAGGAWAKLAQAFVSRQKVQPEVSWEFNFSNHK